MDSEKAWGIRSPYVLVYQDDANVLPRLCVFLERLLDLVRVGLIVDDEEVPLRVRAGGHMLGRVRVSGDGHASSWAPSYPWSFWELGEGLGVHLCRQGGGP